MRINDSPEEANWRAEVRNFLDKELPESIRIKNRSVGGVGFRLDGGDYAVWREKLASKGWIAPAWPKEYGGAGLSTMEQFIMNEEFAEAGGPQLPGNGTPPAGAHDMR